MPRDIARGIASVKRFVRQQSIKGVHGTLIELIECSNRLPHCHRGAQSLEHSPGWRLFLGAH